MWDGGVSAPDMDQSFKKKKKVKVTDARCNKKQKLYEPCIELPVSNNIPQLIGRGAKAKRLLTLLFGARPVKRLV